MNKGNALVFLAAATLLFTMPLPASGSRDGFAVAERTGSDFSGNSPADVPDAPLEGDGSGSEPSAEMEI